MRGTSVLFLLVSLLAFCSSAQAQIWRYGSLDKLESAAQVMGDSIHTNLRPYLPGKDPAYLITGDSATDYSTSKVEIKAFAAAMGGVQIADQIQGIGLLQPGAGIGLNWKDKLFVEAQYIYTYERLPGYLNRLADSLAILPGVGYAWRDGANWQAHNYAGKLAWNINKTFAAEIGRGKHFWGDGYRSLIMSHNSAPVPYAKLNTTIWKIRYVNLWTRMQDFSATNHPSEARNKYVALHALSWNATKKLNVSIYEMVIWQAKDTLSNRGVDLNYMNPIIFFRPVEFQQGSADNVLLAFSAKYKPTKKSKIYFQMLIDEFLLKEFRSKRGWWGNKFGYQLGFSIFDAGLKGLNLQTEFNAVRPFTYTHGSVSQAYGHLNQGAAHPLGTNFVEWIFKAHYEKERWTLDNNFVWAVYGRDRDGLNLGGNIFRSYKGAYFTFYNEWAQGLKSTLNYNELLFSYLLWPKMNVWMSASATVRYESNEFHKTKDVFFMAGFKSDLFPNYRDF
ncbi:MAG: hypothetical protein ACI84C_000386 [Flavobacteriales bacterium]|jgi:hypothetical protein